MLTFGAPPRYMNSRLLSVLLLVAVWQSLSPAWSQRIPEIRSGLVEEVPAQPPVDLPAESDLQAIPRYGEDPAMAPAVTLRAQPLDDENDGAVEIPQELQ